MNYEREVRQIDGMAEIFVHRNQYLLGGALEVRGNFGTLVVVPYMPGHIKEAHDYAWKVAYEVVLTMVMNRLAS